jgi:hypothetical protein
MKAGSVELLCYQAALAAKVKDLALEILAPPFSQDTPLQSLQAATECAQCFGAHVDTKNGGKVDEGSQERRGGVQKMNHNKHVNYHFLLRVPQLHLQSRLIAESVLRQTF